ncbi:hypothetical protein BFJ63_vAg258 [Fusarium oxysporum f. sp. narcissi]|uniref:Uncharacterized protein n=2 Tax=Fusarium oxysporum TaxID=5507 RepID=A0A4Q2WCI2_FUSOX|nr:hypothetical protein BFJ65_g7692 [Fusarium oxysporum f. sp. cepae]RKK32367.1 hypothetical protein BFJ66_g15408 [Fusarium oxysporum f. sp. cepae]RKK36950.1 hypothetical protein BFJ67_g12550 [Fusarium oxysporum f. sp. cepae]RKL50007.1 hypothetical protein BFJ70_g1177 [Fusarium oxysporum]RYC97093.1 hypothetical protein BFJ63_vAg258 [Fusarium oxysporum f. sp. narcissi]
MKSLTKDARRNNNVTDEVKGGGTSANEWAANVPMLPSPKTYTRGRTARTAWTVMVLSQMAANGFR